MDPHEHSNRQLAISTVPAPVPSMSQTVHREWLRRVEETFQFLQGQEIR